MNPGFWHSNFWPDNFWHENFWQDVSQISTDFVHIFSESNIDPNHISDSGNNILIAGQTEAQGGAFVGGVVNYWEVDANGIQTFSGSSAINGLKTNTAADKTNDYQFLITDDNISIDATSNTVTITLEASPLAGRVVKVACSNDTFTADIDFNGNTFYGGSGNEEIFEQEILVIQFNGTEWRLG